MAVNETQFDTLMETLYNMSTGKFGKPLDREEFDENMRPAVDLVNTLVQHSREVYDFSISLAQGNLDVAAPSRRNYMAASLKELHSRLRHLTWQTQQIERGDYGQTVDFMGEFSEAFNKMVKKLSEREQQLKRQVEFNRKSRQALVRSFRAVTGILENLTDKVILSRDDEILFFNSAASEMVTSYQAAGDSPMMFTFLHYILMDTPDEENVAYDLFDEIGQRWYSIHYIRMDWVDGEPANLFVATDITEHKRKELTLKVAADTDALTGVGNRSYGIGALHETMFDSSRYPICVCFLDMDGLKYVNDTYGHAEGDFFIKSVAEAIQSSMRRNDVVARMGGDEFLLIFYNAEKSIAQLAIERILEKLAATKSPNGHEYSMRFSYGITVITKNSGKSAEEYIDIADRIMYQDKKRKKGNAQAHIRT